MALAYHGHTSPATGVRIEPIGLLSCGLVLHLHQVGCIHGIPLAIYIMAEDRSFVTPLAQVLNGCRPHAYVVSAIGCVGKVM